MSLIVIILFSLALGSFATTIISYYLNDRSFDIFRSKCFCGEETIKFIHLLPVVSYTVLKGKCAFCKKKLPAIYLLVELLALLIGIACFLIFPSLPDIIIFILLGINVLCVGIIDYKTYTIPNLLVGLIVLISFIISINDLQTFLNNLLTAIITVILFSIVNIVSSRVKGLDWIGYGDIKLIFALFLCFSFPFSVIALWLSAFIALPGFAYLKTINERFRNEKRVPFGFFIAISFVITVLLKDNIISIYYNLFL